MIRPVPAMAVALLASAALAGGPAVHRETVERLVLGDLDGIAVGSDGRLGPAPAARLLAPGDGLQGAARGWSLAAGADGTTYVGTGPGGRVFRIPAGGTAEPWASIPDPMVTALAVLDDGTVLAAGSPGGRIYRVAGDGSATLWAELGERYVWDLAVSGGRIHAATGENGILFGLDRRGTPEQLFQAPEPHLVRLLPRPGGGILAGGAGRGMLYLIDDEGHGLVLYDDELDQLTGIGTEPDGSILASLMARPEDDAGTAAVRFSLPPAASPGSPGSRVAELEQPAAVIEGRIEGLPEVKGRDRVRGRVIRIDPAGGAKTLWQSTAETPLALATDRSGRPVFGTGRPARLYRCDDHGTSFLLELPQGTVSALEARGDSLVAATSNPASSYVLDWDHREPGVYLSPVLDAGSTARWGALAWTGGGLPGQVEFYSRTGNSPTPDRTWSGWGPARTVPGAGGGGGPDGRYLQWRLRMLGGGGAQPVSGITVAYQPANRPPELLRFRTLAPDDPEPGRLRFAWDARDPDGDPLDIRLEYRRTGTGPWSVGTLEREAGGGLWAPADLPEGRYQVRISAGDHRGNSWKEGRWSAPAPAVTVTVDRTPPRVELASGPGGPTLTVTDDLSAVVRVEILRNGETVHLGHPVDGVADTGRETFLLPAGGEGTTVRVIDAAGNVAERAL